MQKKLIVAIALITGSAIHAGGNKLDEHRYLNPLAFKTVEEDMAALGLDPNKLPSYNQMSATITYFYPTSKKCKSTLIEQLNNQQSNDETKKYRTKQQPNNHVKLLKQMRKKFKR